ncbi:MAG TPA: hypothetical protein PJ986_04370 [Gammaproteobacteria bacterium]|nr:hypothetical protein [Gammaproteobacteria bacterium]
MKHRKGLMLSGAALLGALFVGGAQAAGPDEDRQGSTFNGEIDTSPRDRDSTMSDDRGRPATGSSSTGGAMEDGTSGSTMSGSGTGSGAAGDPGAGGASNGSP